MFVFACIFILLGAFFHEYILPSIIPPPEPHLVPHSFGDRSSQKARADYLEKYEITDALYKNHGQDILLSWKEQSSAHVCSGGTPIEVFHGTDHLAGQVFMSPAKRSCVFRNLCWNFGGSGLPEMIYFRGDERPLPFEYSNAHGPLFDPPSPLLVMGQLFDKDDSRTWLTLRIMNGSIPESYTMAPADSIHIISANQYLENIGHELADGVWPIFNTMLETRMLALDNQLVFLDNARKSFGVHESLSQRPIKYVSDFPDQVCFPWAIAGTGGRGLPSPSLPSLFSWSLMQDFVFKRYDLPFSALSVLGAVDGDKRAAEDLHIVVRHKPDSHSFTNYDDIMLELKRCYPSAKLSLLKPEALSFAEEVRVLASASVYITPGGGGSFTAPFLPRNAVLIIGAACWPGQTPGHACQSPSATGVCCFQVERHVWSNWQYLHVSYYNFAGPASAIVRSNSCCFEELLWNYPVNMTELGALIDRGLFLAKGSNFRDASCIL